MAQKLAATITSKGQITLPIELRRNWGLKPGDQVTFDPQGDTCATMKPRLRRSIFDRLEELQFPSIGRPLTQDDIDEAIGSAIDEKFARLKGKAGT